MARQKKKKRKALQLVEVSHQSFLEKRFVFSHKQVVTKLKDYNLSTKVEGKLIYKVPVTLHGDARS